MNPNGNEDMSSVEPCRTLLMDLPSGIVAIGCKDMVIRNGKYFDDSKSTI